MSQLGAMLVSLAVLLLGCDRNPPTATGARLEALSAGRGSEGTWHVWTEAREIPDGDRRGTLIGPVFIDDNGTDLSQVVLRLDIRHPAPGDLDLHLAYDTDEDGRPDVSIPIEFFRSRSDPDAGETHACPRSLDGTCFFRDSADEEEQLFAAFRPCPGGRSFYLEVADTLAADTGTVLRWAIKTASPGSIALR